MYRILVLLLCLIAGFCQPAQAQKIIEKSVALSAGQRVFLNLKHATNIRIRAGAAGKMTLKAAVDINQNRLNDALQLTQDQSAEEVRFNSELDMTMLRNAPAGDCPDGGTQWGNNYVGRKKGADGSDENTGYRVCLNVEYDITVPPGVTLCVKTISGNIDIQGLSGAIEAKSISGFVDVTWAASSAELALKTITGEVYTDHDVAFSNRKDNPIVGYQLRGNLGSNGPLVQLESISSDIYFRRHK
ncbi:hypothetical protein FY528_01865 [Hymenobacter lutimineralis]|uniref:DUF4097 domain-containing protein n=1 Tax=Hymenobacter lutimineralis TaxID=2606448 RepID=A0A5D6VIG9_9BACT|nr:hypothetical protein [Hymenobacter lutimineralis]TYZ14498.1 hypothetical protein FY528_01865 [Hymenobacter lutimineralis]